MVYYTSQSESASLLNGRYQVQKTLGVRLGRRTLLGYDCQLQSPVIIKYLCFDDDIQPTDIQRFKREVDVLKQIDHPAISACLDYFEIETQTYRGLMLVQQYVEGHSLYHYLQLGQTFAESDLKQIAQQILEILAYLHQQTPAIIHRDVKPSNLVLTNRSAHHVGTVYLVDFGLVQDTTEAGEVMMIAGTEGYMPPEQLGDRAVPASDLYSLGATLIHLATGCHPSELPHRGLKILFAQELGHFSRPFKYWLRWLTEPRLEKRPAAAAEALQVLDRAEKVFAKRIDTATIYASLTSRFKQQRQLFESIKPEGTQLKLIEKPNSLEILIPSGFKFSDRLLRQYLRQFLAGSLGIGLVSYGLSEAIKLAVQGFLLSSGWGVVAIATIFGVLLVSVSAVCFWRGLLGLCHRVQRQVRIQLEPDILLVGYESPLQPLKYVVNARRQDIFDIDLRPDGSSLSLFMIRNRTVSGQLNYRLSARELALNLPEMQWLNDMLHIWFKRTSKLV